MREHTLTTQTPKLTIELVPRTCWWSNVRSEISSPEWDVLRRAVYRDSDYHCEVCGGVGPDHPVECHEVWEYDDVNRVQRLVRMQALCPACHEVKHIGLAQVRGRYLRALRHLADVNNWTLHEARDYAREAFLVWNDRSQFSWELDVSVLQVYFYGSFGGDVKQRYLNIATGSDGGEC